jgi:hypothetical protein
MSKPNTIIVGEQNLLTIEKSPNREKSIEVSAKIGKKGEAGSFRNKSELGFQSYEN